MRNKIFLILILTFSSSLGTYALAESNTKSSSNSLMAPFGVYKPLYFLIGSSDDLALGDSKIYSRYTKFQISFYFRLLYWEKDQSEDGLYFAYTQKSFWHLFNNYSYPYFVETNYSPEIFYRWDLSARNPNAKIKYFQLGLWEHESNGHMDQNARDWDRFYAEIKYEPIEQYLTLIPKIWYAFNVISTNSDIHDYLGYGELTIISQLLKNSKIVDLTFMIKLRKGINSDLSKGSLEINLILDPFNFQDKNSAQFPLGFFFQYFTGYGETLLLYNKIETSFRAGFTLQLR